MKILIPIFLILTSTSFANLEKAKEIICANMLKGSPDQLIKYEDRGRIREAEIDCMTIGKFWVILPIQDWSAGLAQLAVYDKICHLIFKNSKSPTAFFLLTGDQKEDNDYANQINYFLSRHGWDSYSVEYVDENFTIIKNPPGTLPPSNERIIGK